MSSPLSPVEQKIAETLQAGHTLTVRWDCGGDESFVTAEVDGKELDLDYEKQDTDFGFVLDRYLTEKLDLPDVGEFSMQGGGRIFLDGREVVIEYESRAVTYWDDNDDWKAEFSDEELTAMGVELPDRTPAPDAPPATPTAEQPTEAEDDEAEPEGKLDQDMSDDYSGRRVLFTLP